MTDPLRQLMDRQEIADVVIRYARALDSRDWGLLRGCFAESPGFIHPGGRLDGWEAILHRTRTALEPLDRTQHLLGNIEIGLDAGGGRATCLTYFQAQHVRAGAPGGPNYLIGGKYADLFDRVDGVWLIAERVQTYAWTEGNREVVRR